MLTDVVISLKGLQQQAQAVLNQGPPHWKLPSLDARSFSDALAATILKWSERAYQARREHDEQMSSTSCTSSRRLARHYSHAVYHLHAWRRNCIKPSRCSLRKDDGTLTTDDAEIVYLVTEHWSMVSAPPEPSSEDALMRSDLARDFTAVVAWPPAKIASPLEMKEPLVKMPQTAPGPAGMRYQHWAALEPRSSQLLADLFNDWVGAGFWLDLSLCAHFERSARYPWTFGRSAHRS